MELQENKEGLELLKIAIAKAGYTGKVFAKPFPIHSSLLSVSLHICKGGMGFLLQNLNSGLMHVVWLDVITGCHWNGCCCFRIL